MTNPVQMRRILIIGSGGAGKSKLARDLGKVLGLPVIHLDWHYWKPGWVETDKDEWERTVAELITGDAWIMDGNYAGTFRMRLAAADSVIFLDYSRWLCLLRGLTRQLTRIRVDPIKGCYERIDTEYIRWIWNYPVKFRCRMMKTIEEGSDGKQVFICRTPGQTRRLIAGIRANLAT